jgi:hypothetical protein
LALASGLCLTLPGCANKPPSENKSEKKTDNSSSPTLSIPTDPNTSTGTDSSTNIQPLPPPLAKIDLSLGAGKEATEFMGSVMNGTVRADRLTNGFVRAIGLPAAFPADKAKGFSADAAEGLLKRALAPHVTGPLDKSKQIGDVALFRGSFNGKPGDIFLRMIVEGGAWKVDWLSVSSTAIQGPELMNSSNETAGQEFTVAAVLGLLTDKAGLPKEDRAVVLAAGLTPALKKKWADPLDSDKTDGYDYNRALLAKKASDFGAGVVSFSFTPQAGSPDYRVELIRDGGAKASFIVKLAKGAGTGQWLVDDVVPQ